MPRGTAPPAGEGLVDPFGRRIEYLRLSVTDRCNYRCFYCLPPGSGAFAPRREQLTAQELAHLAGLFVGLGVARVRLTGGEPLVRADLPRLAAGLDEAGVADLSLSTNGHLLAAQAAPLHAAGVKRVNLSLDSLQPATFARITGGGDLGTVLRGIEVAQAVGIAPVKINMVVMAGVNDGEIEAMSDFARSNGLELRFIETMPLGEGGRAANTLHYPVARILARLREHAGAALLPVPPSSGVGPARHYQLGGGPTRIGVIDALSRHFCAGCNRVRLSAAGDLILCLGHEAAEPLGRRLRAGADDAALREAIRRAIARKPAGHDFASGAAPLRPMSALGG